MAGALKADACEIYTDVDGVYSADPKIVLDARKLDELSSSEVLELAQHGAKVLHDDAVIYAQRHQIALYAKKSLSDDGGTYIRPDGWPNFALERSRIAPIGVVSAKRVAFVRCAGGLPEWLTRAEGMASTMRLFVCNVEIKTVWEGLPLLGKQHLKTICI